MFDLPRLTGRESMHFVYASIRSTLLASLRALARQNLHLLTICRVSFHAAPDLSPLLLPGKGFRAGLPRPPADLWLVSALRLLLYPPISRPGVSPVLPSSLLRPSM